TARWGIPGWGGTKKNPANKCNPQPTDAGPAKEAKNTENDKAYAMNCPVAAAARVALVVLPVIHQTTARSRRPPSIGNPGTILKTASPKLMYPSHTSIAVTGVAGSPAKLQPSIHAMPSHRAPISALVSGPASPIQNSVFASAASFPI